MNANIRNIIEDALKERKTLILGLPTRSEIVVSSYEAQEAEHWEIEKRNGEGDIRRTYLHFNDEVMAKLSDYDFTSVKTLDKGEKPSADSHRGGVTLAEVRAMAQEVGRKAQTFFHQLSCYEHCTEAMRLREYADRTNDMERIAKRALKVLKEAETIAKSPVNQTRDGKGRVIFGNGERYKCFFRNI